jgi:hypothetical protein
MIFLDIFVLFELLPNFLGCFAFVLFEKLVKIGVFFDQMWMIFKCIHDNVEQGDGTTCIFGVLFHVEEIWGDFIFLKVFGLLLVKGSLLLIDFVEKDNTQYGFDEHILGPFFKRKEFLHGKLLDFKAWIKGELPSFLMNSFMTSGFDSRGSQLSSAYI